jgi:thioredoxin reductase
MLEEAEQQSRIRILRRSQPTGIAPQAVQMEVDGKPIELQNDYVFILIGGESPEGFLCKIGIEIVEKIMGTPAVYETVA